MLDTDTFLEHYGIMGMKWGVRKNKTGSKKSYRTRVFDESPGEKITSVTTKNGDTISIVKEPPSLIGTSIGRIFNRKPANYVSSMLIVDKNKKKVGSFQIWNEGFDTVRGEWLQINKEAQGNGYSKAAINGLIKAAKTNSKYKHVRLQVPTEAEPAKHIYSSLGFKKDVELEYGLEDWVLDL